MPKAVSSPPTTAGGPPQPTAGALLRMTYRGIRERQLAALLEQGFDDLNQPLLNVFLYPPPDRMRPSELAERANMTKQAMNYLLGQLEARGYIERRAQKGSGRRLVFLTKRGWQVRQIILVVVEDVEAEWLAVLGRQRFDEFMRTLRQLWSIRQLEMQGARGPAPAQQGGRPEPSMPPRAPAASRRRRE